MITYIWGLHLSTVIQPIFFEQVKQLSTGVCAQIPFPEQLSVVQKLSSLHRVWSISHLKSGPVQTIGWHKSVVMQPKVLLQIEQFGMGVYAQTPLFEQLFI